MCLDLPPLGECAFGECVNGNCVCDPGVIQSVELLFHPVQGNATVICDYYVDGVIASTIALLVFSALVFMVQVFAIYNLNQLKRQVPILLGYIFLFAALIIRLTRPTDPLWGFDFAFTFFIVAEVMVYAIQIIIFLNRYVEYLDKTLMIKGRSKSIVRISRVTSYSTLVFVVIGSILWIVPVFVEDLETSGYLTKAGCAFWAVNCGTLLIANTYLLTRYILDVEALVNASKQSSGPNQGTDFLKKCKVQIPRMKVIRIINMTGMALFCITLAMAVFLEGWLKQLNFVIYGVLMLYQLGNFCIIRTFSSRPKDICAFLSRPLTQAFEPATRNTGSEQGRTTEERKIVATTVQSTFSTNQSVQEGML